MNQRVAIILFNLGGPDTQAAVKPFLFNLFSDPAIITLPNPLRWFIARVISGKRAPVAQEIYQKLGGGSPILPNTEAQARALEGALGEGYKCFTIMRYWHPRAVDVIKQVEAYKPDRIVLLPLYPQFSTTTTDSSFREFRQVAASLAIPVTEIGCYPLEAGFITSQAQLIAPVLCEAALQGKPRLLLSSHGLPEKIVDAGDPYQWQCEQTALHLIAALKADTSLPEFEWLNTYQSRVGPLKWIGPSTEDEVKRAGADRVPLVVAPMAFVSEHSETLVELDIEYREVAQHSGVPFYGRVPTVSTHPAFINGLAQLVRARLEGATAVRLCPKEFSKCICAAV